ncbi:MAG TPA: hypothetical protein VHX88_20805, partial [Solirubrobacteraceae bacterium]|nr:hypothetical protein [Solirubrobacteraceae bacterium]
EEDAGGEPTAGDPALAARYFNWLQRHCQGCTVLAADLLDGPAMISWLRRFLKVAHKPRLWGLHPYYEGAYGGDGKLEDMLRLVHGRVWFTETGAPVWRYVLLRRRFDAPGQRSQTQELSRELSLARLSSRITRVYVYQWRNPGTLAQSRARLALHEPVRDTWDSGLLRPGCSTRPAFALLARAVGLNPAGAPPAAPTADDLACVAPAVAPTA